MAAFSLAFQNAFRVVIGEEGGFSSDRADPGNWTGGVVGRGVLAGTKYGISAASFPTLDICHLSLDQARAIYRAKYWAPIAGDALPYPLALIVFDAAVNQGVRPAARMLQWSLPVALDGVVGPRTVAAARAAPLPALLQNVAVARLLRYAADPDEPTFGRGWFTRLLHIYALAQSSLGDPHA